MHLKIKAFPWRAVILPNSGPFIGVLYFRNSFWVDSYWAYRLKRDNDSEGRVMKSTALFLSVAIALSSSVAARAAATVDVSGTVRLNAGSGFLPVQSGASVAAGSRLKVAQNGGAVLTFENGCQVRLKAGQVYTVPDVVECASAAQPPAPDVAGGLAIGPAAIGGVAVVGIAVGGVLAATSGKKASNPIYISP